MQEQNPSTSFEEEQNSILEYRKALNATKEQLRRMADEKNSLQEVHEEFKQHYEKLKKESNEISKKLVETIADKKLMETQYEAQMKHLRNMLDQREKVLEEQQAKALLPTDTEMLRAKITREIEAPYKQKLDANNQDLERAEAELLELRRNNKILKSENDSLKTEHERELTGLKQKHQTQTSDLLSELQALHSKFDDTKDKDTIRVLRRESEEARKKAADAIKEAAELRKQRDELKLEKSTTSIEQTKQVDSEQNMRRQMATEIDRLSVKLSSAQADLTAEMQKGVEKNEQIQLLSFSLEQIKVKAQDLELELAGWRKRALEAEGLVKERDAEADSYLKRVYSEEKEKFLMEREEKAKLQKEIEKLETNATNTSETAKVEKATLTKQLENSEKEKKILHEEQKMLRKKVTELQVGYEAVKNNYLKALDHRDALEAEFKKLQEKHRDMLLNEQGRIAAKDHIELTLKNQEEEFQKLTQDKQFWIKERADLQNQISVLAQKLEITTKESAENGKKYKTKAAKYKNKVRHANSVIQQMASRIELLQNENAGPIQNISEPRIPKEKMMGKRIPTKKDEKAPFGELLPDQKEIEMEIAQTLQAHKGIVEQLGIEDK